MRASLLLALKGFAMGMAEVVPGVSGGTLAFITGIYDRLIDAIKGFDVGLLKTWKRGGLKAVWRRIDGTFLFTLLVGMAVGVVTGVFTIAHLLETYPVPLWAFFFGLILASIWYVGRQLDFSLSVLWFLLLGVGVALGVALSVPAEGNQALWFVFVSGVLAVSALMLPGLSGSFVLLLLGMYSYVLPAVKDFLSGPAWENFQIVLVFGLGMLFGLISFSHLLSFLLHRYHGKMYALLTGFMLGSLYKIWPWQHAERLEVVAHQREHVGERLRPVWPADFSGDPMLLWALAAMVLGVALVLGFSFFSSGRSK